MRTHVPRFFVGNELALEHSFWVHDGHFLARWREMNLGPGDELVLFDGAREDRLYKIAELSDHEAHLKYVTDYARKLPEREVYVVWPCVDEASTEAVVRAGVRSGFSHFIPYYDGRAVYARPALDMEELRRLVIAEIERGERSDVPIVREPMTIETMVDELRDKVKIIVCDCTGDSQLPILQAGQDVAFVLPPEGGWLPEREDLLRGFDSVGVGGAGQGVVSVLDELSRKVKVRLV